MQEKINNANVELVTIPVSTRLYTVKSPEYIDEILKTIKWNK